MHTHRSVTRPALLQSIRSAKQFRDRRIVFTEALHHNGRQCARLTNLQPQIVAGTTMTLPDVRAAVAAAQAKDAQITAKTKAQRLLRLGYNDGSLRDAACQRRHKINAKWRADRNWTSRAFGYHAG